MLQTNNVLDVYICIVEFHSQFPSLLSLQFLNFYVYEKFPREHITLLPRFQLILSM